MSVAIAAPAAPRELDRRRMNLIFGTVMLGLLISALDQTIVATALPTIVGDLGGAEHHAHVARAGPGGVPQRDLCRPAE